MSTVLNAPKRLSLPLYSHTPEAYTGPSKAEVLALRQEYLSPGLIWYYKEPLMVVEGSMQYLWDETGKRYLDGFAGIVTVSVGHCHPHVVSAVQKQIGNCSIRPRFIYILQLLSLLRN